VRRTVSLHDWMHVQTGTTVVVYLRCAAPCTADHDDPGGQMTSTRQETGGGPVAQRIRLGARLRRLRQAADLTRDDAGWHIRGSGSKISRMELGRVPLKERDVADLLTLYGVGEEERTDLLRLARQANAPGWWQRYNDLLSPRLMAYLGLEESTPCRPCCRPTSTPGW
jgi:hypothetical protein